MAKDPVCNMEIDEETAEFKSSRAHLAVLPAVEPENRTLA
jgi:hypothetical protein